MLAAFVMDFLTGLSAGILALLLIIPLYNVLKFRNAKTKSRVSTPVTPEPPGAWPILGHLPLLNQSTPACRTLASLADKYGPVFVIRLGCRRTFVISTWEAVKECLARNDKFMASRPASSLGKYIGNGYAIFGLAPDGPYWREMRKIVTMSLLSSSKLGELRHLQVLEVGEFIKELYDTSLREESVLLNEWFRRLLINVIATAVAGKRYAYSGGSDDEKEAGKAQKTIKELMYAAGQFVLSDAVPLPFLEWLDLRGHIKMMKRVSKEVDDVVEGWVEQHRQKRMMDQHKTSDDQDFIDVLLSMVEQGVIESDIHSSDTKIKALVKSMFLGATDSTSVTLTWLVALLLNHQHVVERAKEELNRVVGRERWANVADIERLHYLQAIVKETLRLYPAAPLLVPHIATKDRNVAGHLVKEGDQVLVNAWKVHRDARVWNDPNEFKPDRFLEREMLNLDVTEGRSFWFIPFGSGRRSCPGSEMGLQVLYLTIARLVQGFDIVTPKGDPAHMGEGLGITLPKAYPLEVVIKPRLHSQMYMDQCC